MKVLLITSYYPPIITLLSTMMQEVAEGLSLHGHDVTIATLKPQDNLNLAPNVMGKEFATFSIEKNVRVIRVKTPPMKNKNHILRGLIDLILPHIFITQIRKYFKGKFDVVIVSTPPLSLAVLGKMIKKNFTSKYILFVQDIYPQSLIDIDVMKNKLIIKYFERIEKSVYEASDFLTSHTQGNRKFIIKNNNISPDKISYIPNWIDISPYRERGKMGLFRKKFNLENKFIFLFAGNIGIGQGLEFLIRALVIAKTIPDDICFLIVGEGSEKKNIENIVKNFDHKHIIFKPFVSLEDYPFLAKDADVGIVCLNSRLKTPVVPGKLLGFMAASLPVIGFLNKESDGHIIIKEAGCGYSINSNSSPEKINNLILKMKSEKDKLDRFGKNGYKYVLKNFNKSVCLDKINNLVNATL